MRLSVDLGSDALYFISEEEIEESEEVSPGAILDCFARRRAAFRVSRKEDFKGEIRESICVTE